MRTSRLSWLLLVPWLSGCMSVSTWEWATTPDVVTATGIEALALDAHGNGRATVIFEDGDERLLIFDAADGSVREAVAADTTRWHEVACLARATLPTGAELRAELLEAGLPPPDQEPVFLALFTDEPPTIWRYAHAIYRWRPGDERWDEVWALPILRTDRPLRLVGAIVATPVTFAFDVVTFPIQGPVLLVLHLAE